jgi:hypothetical protein
MRTESESFDPVPRPRWLQGRWRYAALLLGIGFFFTPLAARVAGVQPKQIENRTLVGLPSLRRGFDIFPDLTQWSIDHLPLRNLAIKANARLSENLFGEAPTYTFAGGPVGLGQSPTLAGGRAGSVAVVPGGGVIAGRNGWLFIGDEFNRGCSPELSLGQVTSGIRRLDAMLTASGRRLVMTIAPDKDTVDGQYVPPDVANADCARRAKQQRWAALQSLGLAGYVDLLAPLQQLERTTGEPSYLPLDSHWTQRAAVTVFLKRLLDALSPRLYESARVAPADPAPYIGDLSALAGGPRQATDTRWAVRRVAVVPGLTTETVPFTNFPITHYLNISRPGVPLVRGHALIYGDSFMQRSLPEFAPFFADVTRIPEISRATVQRKRPAAVAQLAAQIAGADVVVVEQTERIVAGARQGSILAPDVLDALQRALAAAPPGQGLSVK